MVHIGNINAPKTNCDPKNLKGSITEIDTTIVIVEKPYITSDGKEFFLMMPNFEANKVGPTPNYDNAKKVSFQNVFVANEKNTAAEINAKLDAGLHIVLQPGVY